MLLGPSCYVAPVVTYCLVIPFSGDRHWWVQQLSGQSLSAFQQSLMVIASVHCFNRACKTTNDFIPLVSMRCDSSIPF